MKTNLHNQIILLFILMISSSLLKAQTGGPGQPEFMQFQQAGTDNMVNPSTGTFSYQIPLFTIGGYPMNLTYQSGIQMEDVSSMVGLGWNLNAGSIVRTLRGLPDDFNNDNITKEFSIKPNETYGGKLGVDLEIAGLPQNLGISVGADMGIFYNNYTGWGLEPSLRGSLSACFSSNSFISGNAGLGMGVSVNSQSGVDKYLSPSIGFKLGKGNDKLSISLGKTWSVNSVEGLKTGFNVGLSYNRYSFNYSNRSYLNNSFQPDIDYPFENTSGTFSGALGWDALYVDPSVRVTGYFSKQTLTTKTQNFPAVGSMYENNNIDANSLMDFNREKKLPYYVGESKILPVPYKTPDVFNLNAQGLSMTFSVSKNDIGIYGDPLSNMNSNGTQAGIEANLGNLFKVGGNFGTTNSFRSSKRWLPDNLPSLTFKNDQDVSNYYGKDYLYQQFCLKNHGEINKFNHTSFSTLGHYIPVKFTLSDEKSVSSSLSTGISIPNILYNQIQPVRQSTINYLTAIETSKMGFDKSINYFSFSNILINSINRTYEYRKEHHLSEITVTQPDGMKYVFGIPVYNTIQKEVTFNVGNAAIDCANNSVTYTTGMNTTDNGLGNDWFFESTTTPAYVTQFLITAVLSPDYRDITNNGISNDDIGNFVKFNYYKEEFLYGWRTPFGDMKATYNKGLRSDDQDDKGTYVYGKKELWYVHSIESKTEIAEYYYSEREDGYGVEGENGGKDASMFLRKLDSISIFSKPDRELNGSGAIPIKTIHFENDNYSLCKKIKNGNTTNTGKLTLEKVSFTYEKSRKGKLTPYIFEYGNSPDVTVINPDYNIRNVNRWGYYQKNNGYSDCNNSSTLSNIDFPYSSQDKTVMDKNAYAWNLTDITIPGGGKIKINYEAHDYGYIQNKTAGQMFMVTGLKNYNLGNNLYSSNKIYFKLNNSLFTKEELLKQYIQDIWSGFLYYKFYVELRDNKYEYITGYAEIKDYGIASNNNFGFVQLEDVDIDDEKNNAQCNPILKTALHYMRINRNKLVFDGSPFVEPNNLGSFAQQLPNIINQLANQIDASKDGVNKFCMGKNYCKTVDLNKSFIRLYNPIKMKIAGGSRVKEISINDNFAIMTGNTQQSKSYTTSYYYTGEETDPVTNTKNVISSGVADYEPLIGGDEISLKQPIFYKDKKKMAPDNDYYVEEPINESLFPAPQIIYSKVTQITNRTTENVGKTGKIINEYFTSKDYPIYVSRTRVDEKRDKTKFNAFQFPFVAVDQQHDFATVSQGYSIVLNNMSGLLKATWVYNEMGDRISGEVMKYYSDNDYLTTIDRLGNISRNSQMGLSVEYTIDGRKSYDYSVNSISQANFNMAFVGFFPIPLIVPLYTEMTEEKQFQSIVVNKVIHRNGILKSKTVFDQSASVTTENLAFDEITGEAILTQTTNEFSDKLYSFKYPAYWMYEGMGPSYINTKLKLTNSSSFNQFLKLGDELRGETGKRLWVKNISPLSLQDDCQNTQGNFSGEYQVYNSGAKNLLNSGAGQVVTWNYNPIENVSRINFDNKYILNSSAIEYYDYAVLYCNNCDTVPCKPSNGYTSDTLRYNDYLSGKKGNWKPFRTLFYLEERTPEFINNGLTNIREEGLFKKYSDFWNLPVNTPGSWSPDSSDWEWKEKVNLTDVDGQTIETEDRISRKVTNLLGYKNTLIIAQAFNSAYGEAYSEGFEDYNFSDCNNWKMNFTKRVKLVDAEESNFEITNEQSHTGKYSLELQNDYLTFTTFPPEPNRCNILSTECNCIGGLYPEKNKEYLFSCWVKVDKPPPVLSCADAKVVIKVTGTDDVVLRPEGPVIEGWQKVMGKFKTLDTEDSRDILITLNEGDDETYYDDIRIHPFDGNMVSYVYDDLNLRLTYILNENNYFTKYEYNNQGELIRIKQETEEGIITKQEGNQSLYK